MAPDIQFRPYDPATDKEKLYHWIEQDPVHRARYGDHFDTDEGTELYVASSNGEDILFLRLSRPVRIEVQFPPKEKHGIKMARALRSGLYKMAAQCKRGGYTEIVFESDSEALRNYMKGLGFTESGYLTAPLIEPKQ